MLRFLGLWVWVLACIRRNALWRPFRSETSAKQALMQSCSLSEGNSVGGCFKAATCFWENYVLAHVSGPTVVQAVLEQKMSSVLGLQGRREAAAWHSKFRSNSWFFWFKSPVQLRKSLVPSWGDQFFSGRIFGWPIGASGRNTRISRLFPMGNTAFRRANA